MTTARDAGSWSLAKARDDALVAMPHHLTPEQRHRFFLE